MHREERGVREGELVDRLHRQPDVHGEERRDAAVDPAELISQQARADGRHRCRAVARHGVADDVQRGELGHQLERELAPLPVRVDDRQYLGFGELPHPVQQPQLILGQLVFHQEVIGLTGEPDVLRQRGDCCRHGQALLFGAIDGNVTRPDRLVEVPGDNDPGQPESSGTYGRDWPGEHDGMCQALPPACGRRMLAGFPGQEHRVRWCRQAHE